MKARSSGKDAPFKSKGSGSESKLNSESDPVEEGKESTRGSKKKAN